MRSLDDTTILFDWNGTIVLDADRARLALNSVLAARALPQLDADQFGERFRLPMRELFRELDVTEPQLAAAESEWNRGMLGGDTAGRPGLADNLLELRRRGARLGIISAASTDTITADLDRLGLPDVWDCVRGGVTDKVEVLREERGGRSRAVYVGDTVYDMISAATAGYRPVGVSDGYTATVQLRLAGAEAIIAEVHELDALLDSDSALVVSRVRDAG